MDPQTARKLVELERRLDTQELPEKPTDLISPFLALPGLRGFWPISAFDSGGDAQDQSGHAHHLAYNGNPTYNYDGLAPYIDLDGTGDYLSRTDEADLDIIGTETYVAAAARGLTLGGWFWFADATAAIETCLSKWQAVVGGRSYMLDKTAAGLMRVLVSIDGTAVISQAAGQAVDSTSWVFAVGRFDPSNELAIFTNGTKDELAAGVPNRIHNSGSDFDVGARHGGTDLLTGRASLCFLCAACLSDAIIGSVFQQTRAAFGI